MKSTTQDAVRLDALRDQFLATVDLLKRRRASEIADASIDHYVALNWLEWHGGTLRLTTTGENMCLHMTSVLGRQTPPAAG
ncbi:MAG: hypothetical protein EOP39_18965 [Rubrivivax sp.]|nr:MAG: hypothetical protein EOP39_18965 [Rubrivivax sp.]